jgi:hypothetical protein
MGMGTKAVAVACWFALVVACTGGLVANAAAVAAAAADAGAAAAGAAAGAAAAAAKVLLAIVGSKCISCPQFRYYI